MHCSDAAVAEAITVLEGFQGILNFNTAHVIDEYDCNEVVGELIRKDTARSEISGNCRDTHLLLDQLPVFRVQKVS
jgi:hypothetical protein